jgi:hypothetical protein
MTIKGDERILGNPERSVIGMGCLGMIDMEKF